MQRIGRVTRLKAGAEEDYKSWHREVWPELIALISQSGIKNYTIYLSGQQLFSYLEVDDWQTAIEFLGRQPVAIEWQKLMSPFMEADDPIAPWQLLEEVFHLP